MHPILLKLAGGDRRSIGEADQVAQEIVADSALFAIVFEAMLCQDPLIRMRAADAVEKATRQHPELLRPYKKRLLHEVAEIDQQEVRWHLAQMLPRLRLDTAERDQALTVLEEFLSDESKIVQVNAIQAMADLVINDEGLYQQLIPVLQRLTQEGSPALKARCRKLLDKLNGVDST